jgi:hypothetical protein
MSGIHLNNKSSNNMSGTKLFVLCRFKWSKLTAYWGQLNSEKLHDLYCWTDIIRVRESRIVRWVVYEARRNRVLMRKPDGNRPLVRPSPKRNVIIEWVFKKNGDRVWTVMVWLRKRTVDGFLQTRIWTIWFHKMWGIFWLAEGLFVS